MALPIQKMNWIRLNIHHRGWFEFPNNQNGYEKYVEDLVKPWILTWYPIKLQDFPSVRAVYDFARQHVPEPINEIRFKDDMIGEPQYSLLEHDPQWYYIVGRACVTHRTINLYTWFVFDDSQNAESPDDSISISIDGNSSC
jgi:hypothetical protein